MSSFSIAVYLDSQAMVLKFQSFWTGGSIYFHISIKISSLLQNNSFNEAEKQILFGEKDLDEAFKELDRDDDGEVYSILN